LAHLFEDALTLESAAAHAALAEISFAAADVFAEMLAAYHGGGPMPATENLRQRINELTAAPEAKKSRPKKKSAAPARSHGKDWTAAEKHALAQAQAAGLGLHEIVVKIDPHCTMPIAARQLIQNAISGIGQVVVVRPDAKSPAASKQVEFVFASAQSSEQIAAKCHIPTIAGDVSVTLIEAASPAKAPARIAEPAAAAGPAASPAIQASAQPAPATPASVPEPGASQAS